MTSEKMSTEKHFVRTETRTETRTTQQSQPLLVYSIHRRHPYNVEAQFEKLTLELEAERQSVANQLEKVKLGSETASMSSISKVLQERGLMDPAEDPLHTLQNDPSHRGYRGYATSPATNGPTANHHSPHSSYLSIHSNRSNPPQVAPKPDPRSQYSSVPRTRQNHPGSTGSIPRSTDSYPYSPHTPASPARPPQPDNYQPYEDMRNFDDDQPDYRNPPNLGNQDYDEPPRSAGYGYGAPPSRSPHGSGYLHDQPPASPKGSDRYGYPDEHYRDPSPPGSDRFDTIPSRDRYGSQPQDDYGQPPDDRYRAPSVGSSRYNEPPEPYQQRYTQPMGETPPMQRAPLAPMETTGSTDQLRRPPPVHDPYDQRWRAPDLQEVIEYLSHPNDAIVSNAASYLQHLTYGDDPIKNKTRGLGGIPPLVELLGHPTPEIQRSACGALRNISYGKQNEENKVAIKNAGGIPALIRLLRSTPDVDVRELVTGVLWNLSSAEPLKKPIIDDGLAVMTNVVIIPHSGWDRNVDEDTKPRDVPLSTVFRNTTGCLRNVSSAGPEARTKMRECEGLVDALIFVIRSAIGKNDMDNKCVENCMCILRNLSYHMPAEVRHPDNEMQGQANKPSKNKPNDTGCFGGGSDKKKKDQQLNKMQLDPNPPPRQNPAAGMELLWQPEVCRPYLSLLAECSNPDTLEAAAGTVQNLTASEWRWAIYIRASVRKDKGLPVLVELLRMDNDRVVSAVSKALRNLSLDPRNKELIGKYAMRDLVFCLPGGPGEQASKRSVDMTISVLNCLHEVILRNMENAKSLRDASGIEKLVTMSKMRDKFDMRIVRAANQVLVTLWGFKDLRILYKKDGWNAGHFTPSLRTSTRPTPQPASSPSTQPQSGDTNNRPSTMSPTSPGHGSDYDTTLPLRSAQDQDRGPVYIGQPAPTYDDRYGSGDHFDDRHRTPSYREDIPMSDMSAVNNPGYSTLDSNASYTRGTPSQSREPQPQVDPREPVYAQVKKKTSRQHDDYDSPQGITMDNGGGGGQAADSWV